MKYFNGFSLINEEELFEEFIEKSDFCIVGFSYGAIKAFEYALASKERIDKLILISPALFQDKADKFIRLQLIHFKKNPETYTQNFLKNVAYPSKIDLSTYLKVGTYQELNELLTYKWDKEKLKELKERGIKIEIYLGEKDKIVNTLNLKDFFIDFATIYYIKEVGHILKEKEK